MQPPASSPEYLAAEQRYADAILAEKSAWEAVRDKLPGSDAYDPQLWSHWQACVARTTAARSALLDMIKVAPPARPQAAGNNKNKEKQ